MKVTFRVAQIALVLAVGVLTLIIFMRGSQDAATVTKKENKLKQATGKPGKASRSQASKALAANFNIDQYRSQKLAASPDSVRQARQSLPSAKGIADTNANAQLVAFWSKQSSPLLAGYHQNQIAKKSKNPEDWTKAGNFYQKAQKKTDDSAAKAYAVSKALKVFKTAVEAQPDNLEAKAGLALTYIEGKQQVMQGVQLLKEVIEQNPRHEKALFYLGMLSIRSGQYKKALERFEKLVEIQPQNPFNHLYLGNVQEQLGRKEAALKEYRKYRKLVEQPSLKANATEKINALKSTQKN